MREWERLATCEQALERAALLQQVAEEMEASPEFGNDPHMIDAVARLRARAAVLAQIGLAL
jgi:hypothetical protein